MQRLRSAEVPSTAASIAGKASPRPELENSQDPKRQRKFIIEAHFARRKSLL
jgi:hypothetical protein